MDFFDKRLSLGFRLEGFLSFTVCRLSVWILWIPGLWTTGFGMKSFALKGFNAVLRELGLGCSHQLKV